MPRILIVDDDIQVRALLVQQLQRDGYLVDLARSGPEALDMIHLQRPDLMLLDLALPGCNGAEVLSRLQGEGLLEALQVLVLTAMDGPMLQEAEAFGKPVMGKPFRLSDLRQRVHALLTSDSRAQMSVTG